VARVWQRRTPLSIYATQTTTRTRPAHWLFSAMSTPRHKIKQEPAPEPTTTIQFHWEFLHDHLYLRIDGIQPPVHYMVHVDSILFMSYSPKGLSIHTQANGSADVLTSIFTKELAKLCLDGLCAAWFGSFTSYWSFNDKAEWIVIVWRHVRSMILQSPTHIVLQIGVHDSQSSFENVIVCDRASVHYQKLLDSYRTCRESPNHKRRR
jgi:hypothetical protein